MARQPRRLAGIGAADIPDASAFDAYIGPPREVTVDPSRGLLRLHDGVTPGGKAVGGGGGGIAEQVVYDGTASGLVAENVQDAIDELANGGFGSFQATPVSLSGKNVVNFTIPSWANNIDLVYEGVSHGSAGSAAVSVQLGDAGGIEATGYIGAQDVNGTRSNLSTGFTVFGAAASSAVAHGMMSFRKISADGTKWAANGITGLSNTAASIGIAGAKTLSQPLTTVRLRVETADNFDAGTATVIFW